LHIIYLHISPGLEYVVLIEISRKKEEEEEEEEEEKGSNPRKWTV
jgi:hypothetical protein